MSTLLILLGMFGGQEILLIALVVLLLFGGRKIPELMRGLGRGIGEFKKGKEEIERDLKSTPSNPSKPEDNSSSLKG